MDIYSNLEGMGFGLKEIRQLWDANLEIAEANNISHNDAISKILKDIKNNMIKNLDLKRR
jgi:hypothetical protein